MTEGCEDGSSGSFLVRVRAQVMMRDDSTGGWVPMGGGGLSNVSVRKRSVSCSPDEINHEYLIFGKRISDQSVVLSCLIKKDFEYYKVMPTFHHWKTGEKKFGLTFQTAADARAFDKGVRTAIEELLQVHCFGNGPLHLDSIKDSKLPLPPSVQTGSLPGIENSHLHSNYAEDPGDDDVFMTLNLPVERGDSQSSSDSSGAKHGTAQPCDLSLSGHPRINYLSRHSIDSPGIVSGSDCPRVKEPPPGGGGCIVGGSGDNYSYVQLTAVHEYIYPSIEDRRDSLKKSSLETPLTSTASSTQPALPSKKKDKRKSCRHCQEHFSDDSNPRGSCEYAPDCVKSAVDLVTCISCAQCMLYHCMADEEGEFVQQPCDCNPIEENWLARRRRWIGLAFLSVFVPCLCCYPPLKACHWCCVRCGLCGGRHESNS